MSDDTNQQSQHSRPKTTTEPQTSPLTDGGTVSGGETVSDGDATAADESDVPSTEGVAPSTTSEEIQRTDVEKARGYVLKASLGVLILLGIIATFQIYLSVMSAISQLVSSSYQPLFRAAFNLVVLLGAGLGIVLILQHLSGQASNGG